MANTFSPSERGSTFLQPSSGGAGLSHSHPGEGSQAIHRVAENWKATDREEQDDRKENVGRAELFEMGSAVWPGLNTVFSGGRSRTQLKPICSPSTS